MGLDFEWFLLVMVMDWDVVMDRMVKYKDVDKDIIRRWDFKVMVRMLGEVI
jgi:hypothetical protein